MVSRVANSYVQRLRRAPNGEKVTLSEKAVLDMLADRHNKDDGFAFPSISSIAAECGEITERHVRRILRSLEAKGVLESTMALRDGKEGKITKGQTSNRYRFCEIDPPFPKVMLETTRKRYELVVQQNRQLRNAQMTLIPADENVRGSANELPADLRRKMSGGPGHGGPGRGGHFRQGAPDTDVRGPRTPMSGAIEPLLNRVSEPVQKEPVTRTAIPTLSHGERADLTKADQERWERFRLKLQDGMLQVPQSVAQAKGFGVIPPSSGTKLPTFLNDFDTCFREWWLLDVKRMPNGILLVTEAGDEAATAKGLEKYKWRLQETARRFFSPGNRKMPITFKLLRSTRPATVRPPAVLSSVAAAEAAMAVETVARDANPWSRVQSRLRELLVLRGDQVNTIQNFRDAIAPVTLESETREGDATVWTLRPQHAKKTQAVMSLFRRELNQAVRDVTGHAVTIRLLGVAPHAMGARERGYPGT